MQIPEEVRKYLSTIGRKGGKVGGKRSRGGGRPPKDESEMTAAQLKRRERYLSTKVKTDS
jgi:hypothetical protein